MLLNKNAQFSHHSLSNVDICCSYSPLVGETGISLGFGRLVRQNKNTEVITLISRNLRNGFFHHVLTLD